MSDADGISIEEPFPESHEPAVDAEEPEPEGTVEVAPGRRMVDVSVVAAERKRARELGEKTVREKELEPLRAKAQEADALRQALDAVKPYVEELRQRSQPPAPKEDAISDDEAANYARRHELYTADGSAPDIKRAKSILADHRKEMAEVATRAAREAVGPIQQSTAEDRSRQNFANMCALKDEHDRALVNPKILAEEWVQLDATLTADPRIAEVVLERAIGKSVRKTGGRQAPPRPSFSEAPGGGRGSVTLTDSAKKLGLTKTDLDTGDKTYQKGSASPIGDWK